jgi:hypothetical protein
MHVEDPGIGGHGDCDLAIVVFDNRLVDSAA